MMPIRAWPSPRRMPLRMNGTEAGNATVRKSWKGDAPKARATWISRIDRLDPCRRVDQDREERAEEHDGDLRALADAEPDHEHGQQGDARGGVEEGDERLKYALNRAVPPDENAQRDAERDGEGETGGKLDAARGEVSLELGRRQGAKGPHDAARRTAEQRIDRAARARPLPRGEEQEDRRRAEDRAVVAPVEPAQRA